MRVFLETFQGRLTIGVHGKYVSMLKVSRCGSIAEEEQKKMKGLRIVDEVATVGYGQLAARTKRNSH